MSPGRLGTFVAALAIVAATEHADAVQVSNPKNRALWKDDKESSGHTPTPLQKLIDTEPRNIFDDVKIVELKAKEEELCRRREAMRKKLRSLLIQVPCLKGCAEENVENRMVEIVEQHLKAQYKDSPAIPFKRHKDGSIQHFYNPICVFQHIEKEAGRDVLDAIHKTGHSISDLDNTIQTTTIQRLNLILKQHRRNASNTMQSR